MSKVKKKMRPVKAWTAVLPSGEIEREGRVSTNSGNGNGAPCLYRTKKGAETILPDGWRIARVEVREI